ncbi:hypothetical protein GQ42DRAFT_88115 [Ramicandelaber brevisporus]|nr:hypothetical protein GQ42DRAFT_88115 [Ramicandelaber brevisporus]
MHTSNLVYSSSSLSSSSFFAGFFLFLDLDLLSPFFLLTARLIFWPNPKMESTKLMIPEVWHWLGATAQQRVRAHIGLWGSAGLGAGAGLRRDEGGRNNNRDDGSDGAQEAHFEEKQKRRKVNGRDFSARRVLDACLLKRCVA